MDNHEYKLIDNTKGYVADAISSLQAIVDENEIQELREALLLLRKVSQIIK